MDGRSKRPLFRQPAQQDKARAWRPPISQRAKRRMARRPGAPCCSQRSPRPSPSVPRWCSWCSRCSPRWCCPALAVHRRCGRWRSCSSRPRCSRATPMPTGSRATRAVAIHLAVTIAAAFALPLSIAAGWDRPPAAAQAFWLIGLFAASIGLPFFALAANSPLLQAWFARTDHPAAKDPYFLYAASNVGSFLALVSYPIVIEPFVRLGDQAWSWSVGFCLLIALLAGCWALRWHSPRENVRADGAAAAPPSWKDAGFWVALAAVPAGLLVAVTAHISTDVAAVPLLWVLPLALYLLTFV